MAAHEGMMHRICEVKSRHKNAARRDVFLFCLCTSCMYLRDLLKLLYV